MTPDHVKRWLKDNHITHQECADRMGYTRPAMTAALNRDTLAPEFLGRFGQVFGWDVVARLSEDQPAESLAEVAA